MADAGLTRLNVSLDSLDPAVFAKITRLGTLEPVLRGLQAAKDAGIGPIKINAVILRGVNDGEICDLLDFAADNGYVLRFIEYMPIGLDDYWGPNSFVPHAEIRERLSEKWSVRPADDRPRLGGGPAVPMLADRLDGRYVDVPVGFISALSHNFCRSCNRVRLSAIGTLRECLSTGGVLSLRDMLRNGDGPADLERSIRLARSFW